MFGEGVRYPGGGGGGARPEKGGGGGGEGGGGEGGGGGGGGGGLLYKSDRVKILKVTHKRYQNFVLSGAHYFVGVAQIYVQTKVLSIS